MAMKSDTQLLEKDKKKFYPFSDSNVAYMLDSCYRINFFSCHNANNHNKQKKYKILTTASTIGSLVTLLKRFHVEEGEVGS